MTIAILSSTGLPSFLGADHPDEQALFAEDDELIAAFAAAGVRRRSRRPGEFRSLGAGGDQDRLGRGGSALDSSRAHRIDVTGAQDFVRSDADRHEREHRGQREPEATGARSPRGPRLTQSLIEPRAELGVRGRKALEIRGVARLQEQLHGLEPAPAARALRDVMPARIGLRKGEDPVQLEQVGALIVHSIVPCLRLAARADRSLRRAR